MLSTHKAINRALDLVGVYRRRKEAGTATSQDLVNAVNAVTDAHAAADDDPVAAFVVKNIAAGLDDAINIAD